MSRLAVDSSAVHSIGHGPDGLEVQFHTQDCARKKENKPCSCGGGAVYQYPNVTEDEHRALMKSKSIGAHFASVLQRKHLNSAKKLDPVVKL